MDNLKYKPCDKKIIVILLFEESDAVIIGTAEGLGRSYIEEGISHDCSMVLMGGAKRGDMLNGLVEMNIVIPEKIRDDLGRKFFFGLENYNRFLIASLRRLPMQLSSEMVWEIKEKMSGQAN